MWQWMRSSAVALGPCQMSCSMSSYLWYHMPSAKPATSPAWATTASLRICSVPATMRAARTHALETAAGPLSSLMTWARPGWPKAWCPGGGLKNVAASRSMGSTRRSPTTWTGCGSRWAPHKVWGSSRWSGDLTDLLRACLPCPSPGEADHTFLTAHSMLLTRPSGMEPAAPISLRQPQVPERQQSGMGKSPYTRDLSPWPWASPFPSPGLTALSTMRELDVWASPSTPSS